jgi:hypothetical protein
VAGQTSRGQSWEDESCKNFETGSKRQYLKPEVKHGTVVAYLRNHHGHELARATFHPHHDENCNVVYKHNSYYGPRVKEFEDHIKGLESRLTPPAAPKDSIYKIHPKVYDDERGTGIQAHPEATHEHLTKMLDHKDSDVRIVAVRHPNANADHLHKGLDDGELYTRLAAAEHPNINAEHIHKVLDGTDTHLKSAVLEHPNVNADHLHKALNDENPSVREGAAGHPNLTSEHLHKALNDKGRFVRLVATHHPNANAEHLRKALDDKSPSVRRVAQNRLEEGKYVKESVDSNLPKNREDGTNSLTSIFKKATPGQTVKRVVKKQLDEAEYQGRDVPLGKPMKGDVSKSKVYVRNEKGNVVKVNFGDKNMTIKKHIPARRKSFRARHNCDNPGPRTKARFWSCKAW